MSEVRDKKIDDLGDVIYDGLKIIQKELEDDIGVQLDNKGYITDCLSKHLYDAGYRLIKPESLTELKTNQFNCSACDSEDCAGCGESAYELGCIDQLAHTIKEINQNT